MRIQRLPDQIPELKIEFPVSITFSVKFVLSSGPGLNLRIFKYILSAVVSSCNFNNSYAETVPDSNLLLNKFAHGQSNQQITKQIKFCRIVNRLFLIFVVNKKSLASESF